MGGVGGAVIYRVFKLRKFNPPLFIFGPTPSTVPTEIHLSQAFAGSEVSFPAGIPFRIPEGTAAF